VESPEHGISMNPRDNEEEPEDSKKERKARTTNHYINNHQAWYESNQAEELKVVMKNSVWKTYE
jgi:hypothetical protein